MKALILNSGMGTRMGEFTKSSPKCMTEIKENQTIISRQLKLLEDCGIKDVVITTGPFEDKLINYCQSVAPNLHFTFVNNPKYKETNYIYSMYLAKENLFDDIVLMHGDLVFEKGVLKEIILKEQSSVVVSKTIALPQKDFKASFDNKTGVVNKIGIDVFEDAVALQPLYFIKKEDFKVWLDEIEKFVKQSVVNVYAENAFNKVSKQCNIHIFDVKDRLCNEIDCADDLYFLKGRLKNE